MSVNPRPAVPSKALSRRVGPALVVALAVVLMALLLWHLVWNGRRNVDEGFYLAAGRATLAGELPAADFGYTQTPLFPRVLALLVAAGGTTVLSFRLFCAGLTAVALALVGWTMARRAGPWAALLTLGTLVVGTDAVYFLVLGKTYAITQLFLVLCVAALVVEMPERMRWAVLTALGSAAIGCRLTAAPSVAVLWLGCFWPHRREIGWFHFVVWPALWLLAVFAPVFLADAQRAWFWMWRYHLLNTWHRHSPKYFLRVLALSPAITLLLLATPAWVWPRRGVLRGWNMLCYSAGLVGVLANVIFAGVHPEYIAPFLVLCSMGAIGLLHDVGGRMRWVLPGIVILVALPTGWRAVPAAGSTLHAEQAAAAAFLREHVAVDQLVLAAQPEIPLAADRRLMPDTVMGAFSVTTDMDEPTAERLGLVHYEKLIRWVAAAEPAAIVMGMRAEECFGGSVPSMHDADADCQRRYWAALERRYAVGFMNDRYAVLLPRAPSDTVLPAQ